MFPNKQRIHVRLHDISWLIGEFTRFTGHFLSTLPNVPKILDNSPLNIIDWHLARFRSPSWMWGSRGKNYSKCMENSSTIDPCNSTITCRILTKNVSLKR